MARTSSSELEFRVLGGLTASRGRSELPLGGRRRRLVLARLLVDAGRLVSADRLVEDIWGSRVPATGTGPLRTYIWELRRSLAPGGDSEGDSGGILVSREAGYLLDIDRRQIDSVRFESHLAEARSAATAGEVDQALAHLDTAFELWQGPPYGDLATEPAVQIEARRLEQVCLRARELRAELLLDAGEHAQVATELTALTAANPQHEGLWGMLMIALYRSGRQSEALRCFQDARTSLVDTMGIEPGPDLQDLEQAVLRQDPALDWQARRDVGVTPRSRPPIPVAGTPPHNLPVRLTSLVGRNLERAAVARALDGSRLVTLSGSGGCGKTRLAEAVAEDALARFGGGVWFVDLAAVADPELVPRAIADTLCVDVGKVDQLGQACRWIADEPVLLVLDNCEHVVDVAAEATEELLAHCPKLHILATSREELRVGAEAVWRVPGLSLPAKPGPEARSDPEAGSHTPAGGPFLGSEAVQLFVERGHAALDGFTPTGEALQQVARICRRLDGIPLAVELAAALVSSLPVADIAKRLDDRFQLLTEGRRRSVPRHQTLRAALDWSFDLLDEPARRLFVRLGVFVGSFDLEAAEAVAETESDPLAAARGLGHLVRTSMVDCTSGSDGAQRYRLLETMRQYALDRLGEHDDSQAVHRRHARYYAEMAVEAERHVHGPAGSRWLAKVVAELPNLRAAIAWAFSHGEVETGLRLAGSLRWLFARMALLDEAAGWLDTGLRHKDELPPDLQLKAVTAAGTIAFMRGEFSRADQLGDEGVALARQLDDEHQLAVALIVQGASVVYGGDLDRAEQCFDEAQELCARLGDRWGTAWLLGLWAIVSRRAGQLERAQRQLEQALAIFRELDDLHGQGLPLVNLAFGALEAGRTDQALELATEAVRIAATLEDRLLKHLSLCLLGLVELSLDHRERARHLLVRSIRDYPGSHTQLMLCLALEGLAVLSGLAGHVDHAVALVGYTSRARERWGIAPSSGRARLLEEGIEQARATIGSDPVDRELERGRSLSLDDAVSLAELATEPYAARAL